MVAGGGGEERRKKSGPGIRHRAMWSCRWPMPWPRPCVSWPRRGTYTRRWSPRWGWRRGWTLGGWGPLAAGGAPTSESQFANWCPENILTYLSLFFTMFIGTTFADYWSIKVWAIIPHVHKLILYNRNLYLSDIIVTFFCKALKLTF